MSLYGPPPNLSTNEGLYAVFSHYSTPWKSAIGSTASEISKDDIVLSMDGPNFARMCREAPGLAKNIGRTEVDLIFSAAKPVGVRRLDFEHFLDALLELGMRLFPDEDPTSALANFISSFVFALFDQPPAPASLNVIEKIELDLKTVS